MAQIKKEPAPSANGTSTKENLTNIIVPEIPADVNPCDEISDEDFCCEVTGDTDIEAYLADRENFFEKTARKKIWEIAMNELSDISDSLKKIISTAIITHMYLKQTASNKNGNTQTTLDMLDVIKDIAKITDDKLTKAIDEICESITKTEVRQ